MSQILRPQGREKKERVVGLTNFYYGNPGCDHCTIGLNTSNWKDIPVVYSTSPKTTTGFYCVKCALSKNKTNTTDLDKYIGHKKPKTESLIYSNGVT